jgi:hypothetical protein
VIPLAQSLNLSVTAEGIETFEQLARLHDLGTPAAPAASSGYHRVSRGEAAAWVEDV